MTTNTKISWVVGTDGFKFRVPETQSVTVSNEVMEITTTSLLTAISGTRNLNPSVELKLDSPGYCTNADVQKATVDTKTLEILYESTC